MFHNIMYINLISYFKMIRSKDNRCVKKVMASFWENEGKLISLIQDKDFSWYKWKHEKWLE